MTKTIHGPESPGKQDAPTPAALKFAGRSQTEEPVKGYGMHTLGRYLSYLDGVREYCRSFDDLSHRGEASGMPEAVPKNLVLDAIANCDKRDQNAMKALVEIADRADDTDIRAAAQRAILLGIGSAFTGITPQL